MPSPRGLIASKTLVPAVGAGTIARPRVLGTLHAAAEGRRILDEAGLAVVEQVATMDDAARRAAELAAAANGA